MAWMGKDVTRACPPSESLDLDAQRYERMHFWLLCLCVSWCNQMHANPFKIHWKRA